METKQIDLTELRHRLGHVLGYVRAASKELSEGEEATSARELLTYAIEKLEKSLLELDGAEEQIKTDDE